MSDGITTPPPVEAGPAPAAPVSWRDVAAPFLALALSGLYQATFSPENLLDTYGGPGLGTPALVLAYFAAVLLMLGGRVKRSFGGFYLMAAAAALALCGALYALPWLKALNWFIILLVSALATFSLSGQSRYGALTPMAIPDAVRLSVLALFTRLGRPFETAGRLLHRGRGARGYIWLSILVSAVVLGVVLALLASADMVFGSFFAGVGDWLKGAYTVDTLWRAARFLALALFIASGLYFLREDAPQPTAKKRPGRALHVLPFLLPAALLDLVYIAFCAVQLRYLFGGAEAAAMSGGWAEYARTGFFQLVAVASINLALCAMGAQPGRVEGRGGLALRIADAALLLLTAVILLSAARRMQLYIGAYGMSLLRLMTLWAMLVIAVGLLAAGWKLLRPSFAFFSAFFGFALGAWCLFCLCSPCARAAEYNVNAYLDGRLTEVDIDYIRNSLGKDAAGPLRRLEAESDAYDREITEVFSSWRARTYCDKEQSWTGWKAIDEAVR